MYIVPYTHNHISHHRSGDCRVGMDNMMKEYLHSKYYIYTIKSLQHHLTQSLHRLIHTRKDAGIMKPDDDGFF